MTFGFKVSKSGIDVLTNTDDKNFSFNSDENVLKIAFRGNLSVSVTYVDDGFGSPIGQATNSFSHNLGYVPISFAFSTDYGLQIPYFWNVGAGVSTTFSYRIDNSKLYISVDDSGQFGNIGDTIVFNFKYQIMADKIY